MTKASIWQAAAQAAAPRPAPDSAAAPAVAWGAATHPGSWNAAGKQHVNEGQRLRPSEDRAAEAHACLGAEAKDSTKDAGPVGTLPL